MEFQKLRTEELTIATPDSPPLPVGFIEIIGNRLFWVTTFPQDEQHAHVVAFDRMKELDDVAILFYMGCQKVAYVALVGQDSVAPRERFVNERTRWLEYLSVPENRETFDKFVQSQRDHLLSIGESIDHFDE
jgi:hypothetical protein